MAVDLTKLRLLENKKRNLTTKLSEYNNMKLKMNQAMNKVDYAEVAGDKACSMFRKVYETESPEVNRRKEELENETDKITQVKNNISRIVEQIDVKIEQILDEITMTDKEIQQIMLAANGE